jgi:TRAP-type uncharacterized transport system fused permease subunit
MFVLTPEGMGLLLEGPLLNMVWSFITAMIGVAAIAGGASTWFFRRTTLWERIVLIVAGFLMVYSSVYLDLIGMVLIGLVVVWQKLTLRRALAAGN